MNDSASLLVARFRKIMKRATANPAQVRLRDAARFVYIRTKRATGSGAFHKNNETRH
jgi:hypothetical protein